MARLLCFFGRHDWGYGCECKRCEASMEDSLNFKIGMAWFRFRESLADLIYPEGRKDRNYWRSEAWEHVAKQADAKQEGK